MPNMKIIREFHSFCECFDFAELMPNFQSGGVTVEAKERAGRNKTIALSPAEEQQYLKKCVFEDNITVDSKILNSTIQGDCLDILPKLPDKFVDLLIVDPPYNLDKTFSKSKFRKMESSDYEIFTRTWIEASLHTLKDTSSIYVCCDWKTSIIIGNILSDYFTIQNRITWQREKGRGSLTNWKNSMEDIWFVTMSKDYIFNAAAVKQRRKVIAPYKVNGVPKDWLETENGNFRDTFPSNFWNDISIPYWSMQENTQHPTQKSEKLLAKLILASTNKHGVILDPFAGAGTSSVTAKKLSRHYVGIEREAEYCALIEKRLEMADDDISIQGYTSGVFWERNSLADQKKNSTMN